MRTPESIAEYLSEQGIYAERVIPTPSFIDPMDQLSGKAINWLPCAKQTDTAQDLSGTEAESMSIASMTAVHLLDIYGGLRVLDVCAAPGMKGLYANLVYDCLEYCVNDISGDRLARLVRLFDKHGIKPSNITKYDARFIDRAYEPESFDRIIIDAPCSGEGVILGGNIELLSAWSPAKVRRLQQLQIGILKSAWKLLKPGGRLIYATCTLNKNENERVIKKALGISVVVSEAPLDIDTMPQLPTNHAMRILPSTNSIGFFISALEKNGEIE